ncbi:MAG: LptA/OstA family protein [Boseongicola sp.]
MILIRFLAVCLVYFCLPTLALAQGATINLGSGAFDSGQPVEVSADALSVDQSTGQAVFDGNVLVVQGEVRLSAERVEIEYATGEEGGPNGIEQLKASGGVTFVTSTDAAEAREAVYSIASSSVILSGGVLLTQGATAISGDRLVVDLNNGSGRMEGRVRTVINAGDNTE